MKIQDLDQVKLKEMEKKVDRNIPLHICEYIGVAAMWVVLWKLFPSGEFSTWVQVAAYGVTLYAVCDLIELIYRKVKSRK